MEAFIPELMKMGWVVLAMYGVFALCGLLIFIVAFIFIIKTMNKMGGNRRNKF